MFFLPLTPVLHAALAKVKASSGARRQRFENLVPARLLWQSGLD
jgi:hypothetical protein